MKLNTLKPACGSVKTRKRVGRGAGSGLGGTSTRGHKGAKARSGYKKDRFRRWSDAFATSLAEIRFQEHQ